MMWKCGKTKEPTTDPDLVCGYIDMNGVLFNNKDDRDLSNRVLKEARRREELRNLEWEYTHKIEYLLGEYGLFSNNYSDHVTNFPQEFVKEFSIIFSEYLKKIQ